MIRSEKLPYVLFITAVAAMFVALGWLAFEMNRATTVPEEMMVREERARPADSGRLERARALPRLVVDENGAAEVAAFLEALKAALENDVAVPNEALLILKSDALLQALRLRAAGRGLEIVSVDPKLRMARVRFSDVEALLRELTANGDDYESVGPNYLARVPGLPQPTTDGANEGGQARFGSEGMEAIGAVGDRSQWGRGTTVAVLDTGVVDHPSLRGVEVTHVDLVNDGEPFNGHGTAMSTLIGGRDEQAEGVAQGVTRMIDVRVADAAGESNTALVASGITKAVDMGARVINISLGSFGHSQVLENAVNYALERNVVIVAAAGNEQMNALVYPAALPGVISVGAVDANGQQAYFSNSGPTLTLAAPGVGIVSGYTENQVVIGSGTSQAAALVSGVATTLVGWGYSGQNVESLLIKSAAPTGAPSSQVGAGVVQVPPR